MKLPSDSAFISDEIRKVFKEPELRSMNRTETRHVIDGENQNYRNTNPAVGTGIGGPSEPKKQEVL